MSLNNVILLTSNAVLQEICKSYLDPSASTSHDAQQRVYMLQYFLLLFLELRVFVKRFVSLQFLDFIDCWEDSLDASSAHLRAAKF
jgi:hypothetical protein